MSWAFWARVVMAIALSIAVPAAAFADEPTSEQRAAVYYSDARIAYGAGRYAEAVELLDKAYALAPKPEILQNLGRAHQRLGHLPEAVAAFERYLATDPFAKDREAITIEVTAMKGQIAAAEEKQRVAAAAAAEAKARADAEAARARWQAWMNALIFQERLERESHHASPLPWIVLGVGVAAGINGAIFGGLADARHRAAADPTLDQPTALKTQDQAKTYATVANVSFIAGGAIGLGGLVWGIIDVVLTGKSKERVRVAPAVSLGWVGVAGSF